MKKILFYLFVSTSLIFLTACTASSPTPDKEVNSSYETKILQVNDTKIEVEISDTPEKRYLGLSHRKSLCDDCGMLFILERSHIPTFVMRDMNIPLDMIWIKGNMITGITENIPRTDQQKLYQPKESVDYVLEVNAGFAEKNNIKINDKITTK